MNLQETAQLLTYINTWQVLPMSDENAMKVTLGAWHDVLDDDLPLDFAMKTCQEFFAEASDDRFRKILPGDLNLPWRKHLRLHQERQRAAIEGPQPEGVPMPDWFKEQFDRIVKGMEP